MIGTPAGRLTLGVVTAVLLAMLTAVPALAADDVTHRDIDRIEHRLRDANRTFDDAYDLMVRLQRGCEGRDVPTEATHTLLRLDRELVALGDHLWEYHEAARENHRTAVMLALSKALGTAWNLFHPVTRMRDKVWRLCGTYDPDEARESWNRADRALRHDLDRVRDEIG